MLDGERQMGKSLKIQKFTSGLLADRSLLAQDLLVMSLLLLKAAQRR